MRPPRTSKEAKGQRKLSGKMENAQNVQTDMTRRAVYSAAKGTNLANFMAIALTMPKNHCVLWLNDDERLRTVRKNVWRRSSCIRG